MKNTKRTMRAVSVAWLVSTGSVGHAQSQVQSQAAADSDTPQLGEIVVTAQRRNESLQGVPLAVSALSADALQKLDIKSLQDLTASAPGFVSTDNVSYGQAPLSIRGIGGVNGGAAFFSDEPVAIYLDGIYVARLSFSTSDLLDMDSVQVLRGPQGSLYGRNATGGAVLITSKRPTDVFEGHLAAGYNSLGDWRTEGVVSGPLAETISARAAVAYSDRRGYGTNTVDGSRVGGSEDVSSRLSLRFVPTGNLTIDLIGEYLQQDSLPATFQIANVTGGPNDSPYLVRPDLQQRIDDKKFTYDDPHYYDSDTKSVTLLAELQMDFATLNYLASYRKVNGEGRMDVDGTNLWPPTAGDNFARSTNLARLDYEQYTQDLRLASPDSGRLTWIAGVSWLHEKDAVYLNIDGYRDAAPLGMRLAFDAGQTVDALAGFGDLAYRATDRLKLTLGGRYSHERKEFDNVFGITTLLAAPDDSLPAGSEIVPPTAFSATKSFDNFTWRAVADYELVDDVMVYASYNEGFKSGGFNTFGQEPAFEPEEIQAYEIGLKSEFAERRARVNVSAFHYDYKDLQIRLPVPTGGVAILNAANARINGGEIEGSFAFTRDFTVDANVAWLDAEFVDGPEGGFLTVPAGELNYFGGEFPQVAEDISGNRMTRAPKWQAAATATYSFGAGSLGEADVTLTYKYQTNIFFLETNQDQPTYRSGDWSETGARFTLTPHEDNWQAAAYVENIFDKRHITQVSSLAGFPTGAVNLPRRAGIQLKYKFR